MNTDSHALLQQESTAGYGDVLGRIIYDLSGNLDNKPAIPRLCRGIMISWLGDLTAAPPGNASGSCRFFIGEQGGAPWGALNAPVLATNAMAIVTGPIAQVTQHGTYVTVVPSAGAQGILIIEFTAGSLKRAYTA